MQLNKSISGLDGDGFPEEYREYSFKKTALIAAFFLGLIIAAFYTLSHGPVSISFNNILNSLLKKSISSRYDLIIWNIRLPRLLTAIVAGAGLSISGTAMQSILRNPLGSPFTLGLSHAAAFGAALSVMLINTGRMHSSVGDAVSHTSPWMTSAFAFLFCMAATLIILFLSYLRKSKPEIIILSGVALGSLFTAATMFLQYFADDVQLSAMVFWTFGDLSRASWNELGCIMGVLVFSLAFFYHNRWNYNALSAGDETAQSLGVSVQSVRVTGLIVAALLTSVIISFLGVIGFVGLICPHISRCLVGGDHRYLLPLSAVMGSLLLVMADFAGVTIMAPHTLPVAILTSFIGAPVFFYLLIRGSRL